ERAVAELQPALARAAQAACDLLERARIVERAEAGDLGGDCHHGQAWRTEPRTEPTAEAPRTARKAEQGGGKRTIVPCSASASLRVLRVSGVLRVTVAPAPF